MVADIKIKNKPGGKTSRLKIRSGTSILANIVSFKVIFFIKYIIPDFIFQGWLYTFSYSIFPSFAYFPYGIQTEDNFRTKSIKVFSNQFLLTYSLSRQF